MIALSFAFYCNGIPQYTNKLRLEHRIHWWDGRERERKKIRWKYICFNKRWTRNCRSINEDRNSNRVKWNEQAEGTPYVTNEWLFYSFPNCNLEKCEKNRQKVCNLNANKLKTHCYDFQPYYKSVFQLTMRIAWERKVVSDGKKLKMSERWN